MSFTPFDPSGRSCASPAQADADAAGFEQFIAVQDPVDAAAAGWMVRRADGLTPAEEAELQAWLAADPEHARALEQLEGVWGRLDELSQEDIDALRAGVPEAAVGLSEAVGSPPQVASPGVPERMPTGPVHGTRPFPPEPVSARPHAWFPDFGRLLPRLALAAAIFIVVGSGWYGWNAWRQQPTFSGDYVTARGQQREIRLPDGSVLWLDTATQAGVIFRRDRREVRLSEGQVQFRVRANPAQPFDVLTGPLRVTVVGTRFSVRNTRTGLGDGSVRVVVEEGRVRVARASAHRGDGQDPRAVPSDAVELTAGQAVAADADGRLSPVAHQSVDAGRAWREGRVSFDGVSLARALAEFERYGDTRLVVRDPAVAALRIHGSFDLRRLDAFARALPRVLPVHLEPTGDGSTEIVSAVGR